MDIEAKKSSFIALLPLIVFVLLFIGSGVISKDFSNMPLTVAALIASVTSLALNRKEKLSNKIDLFTKGAGDANIMLMVLIFVLAGAFSETAAGMGAVESAVNLGLTFVPGNLLIVGLFIVGCFISISMGTSMGTIAALAPIGAGFAEQLGVPMALAMATVMGGAMFGDNLSMISDTTIAAVRTQHTNMSDKFKTNFFIVLPGAIVSAILWFLWTSESGMTTSGDYAFSFMKIIPYVVVLVAALAGMNVLLVLIVGIVLAGFIGLMDGSYTWITMIQAVSHGIMNMAEIIIVVLLIGGMTAIVKHNGGIEWLLQVITSKVRTKKGAEFGIAGLVSAADIATANNTISILITGPLAKNIADEYEVDPRKSASLLDIFASFWQGLLPYSPQILTVSAIAGISPLSVIPYSFYTISIGVCGMIAILTGYPKYKKR